jgi:hypothetical protein
MNLGSGAFLRGHRGVVLSLVVCLLVFALPASAFAVVTWANQCPAVNTTYHSQPGSIYVDVFGTAVNKTTAFISLDNGPNKAMSVTAKAATGHWELHETLQPDGLTWKATWAWVADNPALGSTKVALAYYPPGSLGDGQHRASVSVKNTGSPATQYSTWWWFTIQEPPTLGVGSPANGSTVTNAMPTVSIPVADNTYVDYCEFWANGNYLGGVLVSAPSGVASMQIGPLPNGPTNILIQAFDGWGNETDKAWTFTVAAP